MTANRWISKLRLGFRSLFGLRRVERELSEELEFHLARQVEANLADGMTEEEARREARRSFGGLEVYKEECRDWRGTRYLEDAARDLAYAWRGLLRNPGFTLTAVATIALGVGVNTALFSLIYAVVFRPLPVKDPDTLRNVYMTTRGEGQRSHYGTQYFVSFTEFQFLRSRSRTAELAGIATAELSWKGSEGGPLRAQLVSENLLPLLGGRPLLGRFFTAGETATPGSAAVVVLSHALWQRAFGGALDVVGRQVTLNRTPFQIIGVADAKTTGPLIAKADVWIPFTMQALTRPGEPLIERPTDAWIQVFARRKAAFDDGQMLSELRVLGQQALEPHNAQRKAIVTVAPGAFLNYPFIMRQGLPVGIILFSAVFLVLIVACANVANMLLARGLSRRREMAIRLSIGAGRGRLLRQLLTESLLLSLAGAAAGLVLAQAGAGLVLSVIPLKEVGDHQINLTPDSGVLLYGLALALLTSLFFGLVPALRSVRLDLTPAMKTDGRQSSSRPHRMLLQKGLVAVQVAVCLVVMVNAALLLRAFRKGVTMDVGHATDHLSIASFDLRQQQYTPEKARRFLETLRESVSASSGVQAATLTFLDPLLNQCGNMIRVLDSDGRAGAPFRVACEEVSDDYFKTMEIPILAGRTFHRGELRDGSKFAIVDERLASLHFAGRNPLGQKFREGETDYEIVGVAGSTTPLDMSASPRPTIYKVMEGLRFLEANLIVKHSGSEAASADAVRQAAGELDAEVNLRIKPISQNIFLALTPIRLAAGAASALGGLALLLACTGVYGVISFAVRRRTREIGIRLALGAGKAEVLAMIVRQGLKPVAVGAITGLLAATAGAHLIRTILLGLSPMDPASLAGAASLLLAVAAVAIVIPGRAALRVDPSVALRHD